MQVKSQRRYRIFLIVLVYFIMAMMGVRLGISSGVMSREREIFYAYTLSLLLTQICIVDSRMVGQPLSIFSYWLIFIFYGIAVPVCIIRARGKAGLVIVGAHFICLMLVKIIFWFITSLIMYGRFF